MPIKFSVDMLARLSRIAENDAENLKKYNVLLNDQIETLLADNKLLKGNLDNLKQKLKA